MRTRVVGVMLALLVLIAGCQATMEMAPGTPMEKFASGRTDAPGALADLEANAAVPATSPAEAPAAPGGSEAPAVLRQIIYNGGLRMVVPDIAVAERSIQQLATSAGGYLQELDGSAISVRVPAAKFEVTLAQIERLGEVVSRHVKANDVTEELRDLRIRLENAEQVRKRLTDLIAKADKIEDTIKLEQELERVTQTLELLKGKLQYMQDQVAFSTIRVELNSPRPQGAMVVSLPFSWVRELGDGAVAGVTESAPDADRFWRRNERFTLPAGFVRYFERDHVTEAMSADEVVIKLRRQDNYAGGDLGFWMKLARRAIVENRAIAVEKETDTKVKDGSAGHLMVGVKDQGPRKEGYLLGIVITQRYVYTFEAWGDREKMGQQEAALTAAFESLDVKHW